MQNTMPAILMMVLAMALLALSDMFIKLAAQGMPVGLVAFALSFGGVVIFVVLARFRRIPLTSAHFTNRWVVSRNVLEIFGGVGLVLGIAWSPLSVFAAIMQASPLMVTIGAAVLLNEPVGWRRWTAVLIGLLGMLRVVQPWADSFEPAVLFAVLGVTALSLRDLVTRLSPPEVDSLQLATWGFMATVPSGLVILLVMGDTPTATPTSLVHVALAAVVTTAGYYAVTSAMRMAPASIVAPFRYSRLIFTMGLGILVFGERPDAMTLTGAAIILATGFYTFMRERRLASGNAK